MISTKGNRKHVHVCSHARRQREQRTNAKSGVLLSNLQGHLLGYQPKWHIGLEDHSSSGVRVEAKLLSGELHHQVNKVLAKRQYNLQ